MDELITKNQTEQTNEASGNGFLGVRDVAKELNVSKATILRWLKSGKLDGFFQIGRKWLIRKSDFENFISGKISNANL